MATKTGATMPTLTDPTPEDETRRPAPAQDAQTLAVIRADLVDLVQPHLAGWLVHGRADAAAQVQDAMTDAARSLLRLEVLLRQAAGHGYR